MPLPIVDFSADPTSGAKPLNVTFTDATTNAPTAWSWDFGDGSTSTSQNPSHTYTKGGAFTVTLTATNDGGANTATMGSYISVVTFSDVPDG